MQIPGSTEDGQSALGGAVSPEELKCSISQTRATFSRSLPKHTAQPAHIQQQDQPADFITLIYFIGSIYRDSNNDILPIQQFHPDAERHEDGGHTLIVSSRLVRVRTASNLVRGQTDELGEDIVVKRPRESVWHANSKGIKSLLNELRIRSHTLIRKHPNIVKFMGIAWDFEDEEATKPRPLLLEELAPQRSLPAFWRDYNLIRMTFQHRIEICLDVLGGLGALHGCGIVHGDVKPENILIFPREGHQDSFMAKLTDFGDSILESNGTTSLPAFTLQWAAPEILEVERDFTFADLIATDVYSYGLVILSIILGQSYYESIVNYKDHRANDTLADAAFKRVEKEDP